MIADRVATIWFSGTGQPRIAAERQDRDYGALAIETLDGMPMPGPLVARRANGPAVTRHLEAAGLIEEVHFGIPLNDDGYFCAFLGRLADSGAWSAAERIMMDGCATLLGSIVTAHVRCLGGTRQADAAPVSAERRLERAFQGHGLTLRESEIASKILLGYSTLAIALEFDISENTVKVHRKHLNQKLGVRSQAELFGFAYRILMENEALHGA